MLTKTISIKTHRNLLSLAIALGISSISVQSIAASNVFGEAIGTDSVALGQNSIATAINGIANGKSSVATGDNLTPEKFAEIQAEELAKLAQKAELTNQLMDLKVQLAKAQEDKRNFQNQLNKIDQQIAQNEADSARRSQLQAEREKLASDSGVDVSKYSEFVNYYDVLSSLDWAQYGPTGTGLTAMRDQLKRATTAFAPSIASQISDEKYNEYILGYVNVETTLTSTLNKMKSESDVGSYNLGRDANDVRFKDSLLNSYINELTTVMDKNILSKKYKNLLQSTFEKENVTDKDISFIGMRYTLNNSSNSFLPLLKNINILNASRIVTTNKERNDENMVIFGNLHEQIGFFPNGQGYYANAGDFIPSLYDDIKGFKSFINEKSVILPTKIANENNSSFGGVETFNPSFFIFAIGNEYANPLLNENSDYYAAYKQQVDSILNLYENIDVNYSGNSMVNVAETKAALTPYYNQWKEAQTLLNMYEALQIMPTGNDKQAAQSAYIERLNKFRSAENIALLKNFQTAEGNILRLDNPNVIQYTDEYKTFLKESIKSYQDWLESYEPHIIGYSRTDEYINQIEKIANKLKQIDEQMPEIPSNPTRDEAQNGLDEAEKVITSTNKKITNVTDLINAIKPSLTERGINSIAVGTGAFASGVASIAMGNNTVVIGDQSTGLGRNNLITGRTSHVLGNENAVSGDNTITIGNNNAVTASLVSVVGANNVVSGSQSIAYGNGNVVNGEKSIAIGVGHNVSGNRSTTIGDPNVVSGDDAFVAGNNNNVASNKVMVVGNNVNVAQGFDGAVVLGDSSTVAAANPTANMQIRGETYNFAGTNPTSTVSVGAEGKERQLVNVAAGRISNTSTDAINGSQLYALADAVNKLETGAIDPDDVSDAIQNALTNNLKAGNNVTIDEEVNPDTNQKTFTIHATQPTISAGDNITVNKDGNNITINAVPFDVQAGTGVTVNKEGNTFTVNAKQPDIQAGTGVTIDKQGDTLTINAQGKDYRAGDNVVMNERNENGVPVTFVSANSTTVSSGAGITVTTTTTTTANGATNTNYEVALAESLKAQIAKEESVTGEQNIIVTQDGANETGGKNFVVRLANDVDLGDKGSLKLGDIEIAGGNINMGGNQIQGVAKGKKPTDAVNVEQLNEAKSTVTAGDKVNVLVSKNADGSTNYTVNAKTSEVKGGTNAQVVETTGDNGQSVYTVNVKGDLTDINSIQSDKGTKITLGDTIDVGGARISNVGTPVKPTDAVNKAYVDRGIHSQTDDGKVTHYKLGDTITVTGDGKNLSTATTNGKVQVKLADDVKVNSVSTGDVSISRKGVNAGGKKVTNVAPATLSPTSTEAVNGSQLYATNLKVNQNTQNIVKLGDRVNHLDNKLNQVNKDLRAGVVGTAAIAGLPQVRGHGKSMFAASAGNYKGQSAIAVGYTRASDNGKLLLKLSGSANTQGDIVSSVGLGYEW